MVYSALVIEENNLAQAREIHNEISKIFKSGYIKSSKIDNVNKRISALKALAPLKHYVYTLVVDKIKIDVDSGLKYKKSFVKFFQRILTKKFFDIYDEFHIYSDKYGDIEFQESLYNYLERKGLIGSTLFTTNSFEYKEDHFEEPLLQLADLYAGTISKYFCNKYQDPKQAIQIYNDFISKRVSIDWFPIESMTFNAALFSEKFNEELFNISLDTAKRYIEEHQFKDVEGVEMVKYIIQESCQNPFRVISSKEIKSKMSYMGYEIGDPITKISSLRSSGVIIISPIGKKGYKLPTSDRDIAEFYERLQNNIKPQLVRCKIIDDMLLAKSFGKYGLLKTEEYKLLSRLCEIATTHVDDIYL